MATRDNQAPVRRRQQLQTAVTATAIALLLGACGSSSDDDDDDGGATVAKPAAPAFAAGERIVFTQQVGEHRDLFTVRPDGSGLKRLTRSEGEAGDPDWSADGRLIVFSDQPGISIIRADGTGRRQVGPRGEQGQPSWSPDGRSIVLERDRPGGDNGVWIMRADGSGLRRLTRNPYRRGVDTDPNVSPDGRTVSFVRRRSMEGGGEGALFTMDTRGRNLRRITDWDSYPGTKHAWKPDGSLIAFSYDRDERPGESSNVAVVRPDGTGLRMLTSYRDGERNAFVGDWSPDGRHLVYKDDSPGGFQLYVMDANGGSRRAISTDLDDPATSDWTRAAG